SDTIDLSHFTTGATLDLSSTSWQTVSSSVLSLALFGNSAVENIVGGSGADTLTGNTRDNIFVGGAGNDSLTGGAGNDTYVFDPFVGNLGSDTVTEAATADTDTLDFSNFASTTPITLDLGSTSAQTVYSGVLTLTLSSATGIENVIGGAGNDNLTG